MSTQAYIAKQIGPDQYLSIFCKCNGYLEHLGTILAGHYDTEARVDELLSVGDVYALFPKLHPDPSQPHSRKENQKGVTIAYGRDMGDNDYHPKIKTLEELDDDEGLVLFGYIFADDQRWKYFHNGQSYEGLRDLKEVLEHIGMNYKQEAQELESPESQPEEAFDMKL